MTKALLYKEWIKTRYVLLLLLAIGLTFVLYNELRIAKIIELKGATHLWEILLAKETVFFEPMKFVPLISGCLLAITQFAPEMLQKRLKLTLHLPISQQKIVSTMLLYGLISLLAVFTILHSIKFVYLQQILVSELVAKILVTTLPWYLAGICGYAFSAWICLEPAWRKRIVYTLFSLACVRLLYLSPIAQGYQSVTLWLTILSLLLVGLSFVSVERFKKGIQN